MSLASYHCSTPGSISLLCRRGRGFRAPTAMALEHARRRKFAELMPNHVFGHEQLHEILAVVDHERVPDKIGNDRAIASPGLERLSTIVTLLLFDFRQQAFIHIRAFFQRTSHSFTSISGLFNLRKSNKLARGISFILRGIGFQSCHQNPTGLESCPTNSGYFSA